MTSATMQDNRPAFAGPLSRPPVQLDSGFGDFDDGARSLAGRRYSERGLAVAKESFNSRSEAGDIVCSARQGEQVLGTITVRFDGVGGLHTDLLFEAELAEWRAAGVVVSYTTDPEIQNGKAFIAQGVQSAAGSGARRRASAAASRAVMLAGVSA